MVEGCTARLILMCGLPGAGKTTLARRLAEALPAIRLCPDERLAQELLRQGLSVILESGFWLRADRDEKREGARALGVAVELRYLPASLDELHRRLRAREAAGAWHTAPITRAELETWASYFDPPDTAELALFDPPAPDEPA